MWPSDYRNHSILRLISYTERLAVPCRLLNVIFIKSTIILQIFRTKQTLNRLNSVLCSYREGSIADEQEFKKHFPFMRPRRGSSLYPGVKNESSLSSYDSCGHSSAPGNGLIVSTISSSNFFQSLKISRYFEARISYDLASCFEHNSFSAPNTARNCSASV